MAFTLTDAQLHAIMPHLPAEKRALYLPYLVAAMSEFAINTPLRAAAFLAQIAEESGEMRWLEEIASGAEYEGRKDLGNTQPGDGKRFKGRGVIQLTGRTNYARYGYLLGLNLISQPEIASQLHVCFRVAGLYWKLHDLNPLADAGDMREITHRINGGYNGLAQRMAYYHTAKKVLGI